MADAIPVFIGDYWTFAFTYRESALPDALPVDLTDAQITASLYYAIGTDPLILTAAGGNIILSSPATDGAINIGVPDSTTNGFAPSATGSYSSLAIEMIVDGVTTTIGVPVLSIFDRRSPPQLAILTNLQIVDPISGRTLTFMGRGNAFPASQSGAATSGLFSLDYSTSTNFISTVI